MRIGNLEFEPAILLAPMEAVTDLPFRTICEEQGAALTFTEFLSAEALTRGAAKALGRMWPSLGGRRFAVQIFGREPDALARATEMAVEAGAAIVDINMGCPAKKVTAGACGSALMREPELAAALVAAVRRAAPATVPVTVKHRAGWDESSLNAAEFARRLVDAGAAMITVHGRTRAQGFSGAARLEPIAAVRAALPREIPVIGNGDVKDVAGYLRMKVETGCDGVMIGRGAMGNPWFFRTLAALERGTPDPGPPALDERRAVWRRHAALVMEHSPERMRVHELRKTLAWYSRGLRGGGELRQRSGTTGDPAALLGLGEAFFEGLEAREAAGAGDLSVAPDDPVTKSIARRGRAAVAAGVLLAAAIAAGGAGCDDLSHRDIGDEINILVRRNDQLVGPATDRLVAYKREAVPQIETALHTAAPPGRLHLVAALGRIADDEAVPILRHVAVYDVTPEVREAAQAHLARWAAGPSEEPRAARARVALAEIARKRASGEGPLLFGDAGVPGMPATVGAPEPVGANLDKKN
jgi:nifR3 family TIM-barrel protein